MVVCKKKDEIITLDVTVLRTKVSMPVSLLWRDVDTRVNGIFRSKHVEAGICYFSSWMVGIATRSARTST